MTTKLTYKCCYIFIAYGEKNVEVVEAVYMKI